VTCPNTKNLNMHIFREKMENNEITLVFTSIQDMWAYMFTKALPKHKHFICLTSFGLFSLHFLVIGEIYDYICHPLSNFGHILHIWMNGEDWENTIQVEWLSSNGVIITFMGIHLLGLLGAWLFVPRNIIFDLLYMDICNILNSFKIQFLFSCEVFFFNASLCPLFRFINTNYKVSKEESPRIGKYQNDKAKKLC
jgi:hypothetical protein